MFYYSSFINSATMCQALSKSTNYKTMSVNGTILSLIQKFKYCDVEWKMCLVVMK